MNNIVNEKLIYCPSWDYLVIAQWHIDNYKDDNKNYNFNSKINVDAHAIISILFSWLSIETALNDVWSMCYRKESKTKLISKYWCEINEPEKWKRKKQYERLDYLNQYINNGEKFFESEAPFYCRDLFRDFSDLRNCVVHSVPDIQIVEKEILERDILEDGTIYTKSKRLSKKYIQPVGRFKNSNLRLRMTRWNSLKNIRFVHAIESFKITLAIFHKMKQKFNITVSGIFVNGKLVDFENAYLHYCNVKKSNFDDKLKEFFFGNCNTSQIWNY